MIKVFFGYRDQIGHLIFRPPPGEPQIVDDFAPEIEKWCIDNLSGPAYPEYVTTYRMDEKGVRRGFGHYEFVFENDNDAALFKLFHVKQKS